jgi:hypothetical protein
MSTRGRLLRGMPKGPDAARHIGDGADTSTMLASSTAIGRKQAPHATSCPSLGADIRTRPPRPRRLLSRGQPVPPVRFWRHGLTSLS